MYAHIYTVRGRTYFPLDMLRYDGSYPRTQDDVAKLHTTIDREQRAVSQDITLIHIDRSKLWKPTAARWSSFAWQVVEGTHQFINLASSSYHR